MSIYSANMQQLANDDCTPEKMAAAGVDVVDATWYHTTGRHLTRASAQEVTRIMKIRHKVRCSHVVA